MPSRTRRTHRKSSRKQRGGFLDWLFGSSPATPNAEKKNNAGVDMLAAPATPSANVAVAENTYTAPANSTAAPVGGRRKTRAHRKGKSRKANRKTKSRKGNRKAHRKAHRKSRKASRRH